jgi:hypothetical protein
MMEAVIFGEITQRYGSATDPGKTGPIYLRRRHLEMIAMRRWLDHNGYELTRFECDRNGKHVIVSVDLALDAAAAALAEHFHGQSNHPG